MLTTAGEMLVRVNGRLQGGIDPNRETLLLPPSAGGRYAFDIEGYNRSKPDDDRNEDTMRFKGCRQVFQGGWFAVDDEDAVALYHDVSLFFDIIQGGEFDEDYTALVSDRLFIPPFPGEGPTSESLNAAVATAVTVAEFRRRLWASR